MTLHAIVLQHPWAPLAALGIKTFETRSYQPRTTLAAGDDLAIVLGRSAEQMQELAAGTEGGWLHGCVGGPDGDAYEVGFCTTSSDEGTRGTVFVNNLDPTAASDDYHEFTIGTVLAVVTYGGAAPIVDFGAGWDVPADAPDQFIRTGLTRDPAGVSRYRYHPPRHCIRRTSSTFDAVDITDQMPYGVFTPGRYAWPLSNPRRLTDPVPCTANQPDGTRISMQGVFTLPAHTEAAIRQDLNR